VVRGLLHASLLAMAILTMATLTMEVHLEPLHIGDRVLVVVAHLVRG